MSEDFDTSDQAERGLTLNHLAWRIDGLRRQVHALTITLEAWVRHMPDPREAQQLLQQTVHQIQRGVEMLDRACRRLDGLLDTATDWPPTDSEGA